MNPVTSQKINFTGKIILFQMKNDCNMIHLVEMHFPYETNVISNENVPV